MFEIITENAFLIGMAVSFILSMTIVIVGKNKLDAMDEEIAKIEAGEIKYENSSFVK